LKILVSPNALKGSLSAEDAAHAIEVGIKNAIPSADVIKILVSDGGDGFVDALQFGLDTETHSDIVTGPSGERIKANFLFEAHNKIAIIEMASASGLALLKNQTLDALAASSIGTGELIKSALNLGAKHIILGIGGSATSDGGTGMATALGVVFRDANGKALEGNAKNLQHISSIDTTAKDKRLNDVIFDVACDVNNTLLGPEGAAAIYSPQKGANEKQVKEIESGLDNLATIIENDLSKNIRTLIGGGAAGGLGATLDALFNAKLKPGAELLLEILHFDEKVQNADLVITTEGKLDEQTIYGKAPAIVANHANNFGVPTIAIAGQIDTNKWQEYGFKAVYSLCSSDISVEYAIYNAAKLLTETTKRAIADLFPNNLQSTKVFQTQKHQLIVYTDLDGTLLDHNNYSFENALPALSKLNALSIPVIPVSSKTLPEIIEINSLIGISVPIVAENGGVIAFPKDYFKNVLGFESNEDYFINKMTTSYESILNTLNQIRNETDFKFTGFSDMSIESVMHHTSLPYDNARNAKKRIASEPILWMDTEKNQTIFHGLLEKNDLTLVKGGRFWHVMGKTNKGQAIKKINQLYLDNGATTLTTIGLGDSPNDIPMLTQVNIPVIVKRSDGSVMEFDGSKDCSQTKLAGPNGWNAFILQYINQNIENNA